MTDKSEQTHLEDDNELTDHPSSDSEIKSNKESHSPTHLVALGASAGGLESLERFFRAMPDDTGMAFAVVQHLSPDYKNMMEELMSRFTKMPVAVVASRSAFYPITFI